MKLTNLKIGTQLKLGLSFIILLIILLGSIFLAQTDKMAIQTAGLEHSFTVSNALDDLKSDVLNMHHKVHDFCLIENGGKSAILEKSAILQDFNINKAHAFKQLDLLYKLYSGPREDVDKMYNSFVKLNTTCEDAIHLLQDGKKTQAIASTRKNGEEGQHMEIFKKEIEKIEGNVRNKGYSFYQKDLSLNKATNMQLFVGIGSIILFVFMLVLLLNRNIRRSIGEINVAVKRFNEGNFDTRCSYVSGDEFGFLSASFNNFAETIEKEYKLNQKSAKLARKMLVEEDAHRFCQAILSDLIEDTWSQMGAIYLLNDAKTQFEYFECIGMNAAGCKPFSATRYEGEFGKALITKRMQYIRNIPEDSHFTFSTVSGTFLPREIITIPILSRDEVVAVISLANIKSYSKNSLQLINSILDILNARMGGILAHRQIIASSQKLEFQNMELESQKKELSAQACELQKQNMELEIQKKQLDESNRLKTSFLSNMSHELRTPLNSVIALSGVLNRRLAGKVPEEEYSYLDVIERNGRNLLLLINDILDLSRIESGREEIEISTFNVNNLINEIIETIKPQANQKRISLSYIGNDKLPPINSDYEKLLHIIQNILGNAVKFTETGSVKVTAEIREKNILITVSDTGIGISKENITNIFDEFRQVDGSSSRKYGGTGLGLSISKKYAKMLGGNIKVESTFGEGSKFTLCLPLHLDRQNAMVELEDFSHNTTINKSEKITTQVDEKDKTILLVEDTEAVVIQMKDILQTQGYNMMVAHNGNEAIERISRKMPDGLILDLMMPEVDGFEVLKNIREKEISRHLPVIVLTAKYVTKEEYSFLKQKDILQLIHKGDVNKEQLLGAVASMFCCETEVTGKPQKSSHQIPVSDMPIIEVVEDNPDNMITIKALLSKRFKVIEAEDGARGIEMAKKYQPQLILMDIALPCMNGIEALNELRKDDKFKNIPVIAVSASAMKGDRENFMDCGFDDYISKPIENGLFMQVIDKWI